MTKENIRTTGAKAESYEAGLEHLRTFAVTNHGTTFCYALMMEEDDGTFTLYERVGMPCWGALREYETGTRPKDRWPGDLREPRHLFPKTGKVSAVSACFSRNIQKKRAPGYCCVEDWNTFIDFCFNPEISPWKAALKDFELIKNRDGAYFGAVFKDTHIDPNMLLCLLRANVLKTSSATNFAAFLKNNPGVDPRVAYLKTAMPGQYYLAERVSLKNFFLGESTIPMEGTLYDRTSYNRPDIEFIFGGKNNAGEVVRSTPIEKLVETLKECLTIPAKREQDALEAGDTLL